VSPRSTLQGIIRIEHFNIVLVIQLYQFITHYSSHKIIVNLPNLLANPKEIYKVLRANI